MLELRAFRYFVAVAEELHFGRAASRLNIAQPALSIQIRQLEERIGGPLFERTNRSVRLTRAGQMCLEGARDLLARAARAEAQMRKAARGEIGQIDIAYSSIAAYSGLLRQSIACIRARSPGIEVHLHELEPRRMVDSLAARSVDFALGPTLAIEIPETVLHERMMDWPLRVAMPRDHPLAQRDLLTAQDLLSAPFIVFADQSLSAPPPILTEVLGQMPEQCQYASSASLVLAMVGAGLGLSLVPSLLEKAGALHDVVLKPIGGVAYRVDCALMSLRDQPDPVLTRISGDLRRGLDATRSRTDPPTAQADDLA